MKERVKMLKSMTGFGRYEVESKDRKFIIEIKAVNHRYSDFSIRIPKKLSFFEVNIRSLLKQYISRGKIDVFITYEESTEANLCVKYNEHIAEEYIKKFSQIAEKFQLENDIKISNLSRYPEVLSLEEQITDESECWKLLEEGIEGAAERLVETRVKEGKNLLKDIEDKLRLILNCVSYVEDRSPQLLAEYREKITNKVNELLGDTQIDDAVLSTELILYADKICVDEETVRLRSHIKNMKETLVVGENIGRKLDFIAQEMNREANTILSKANDIEISNCAIELKTEIEKIREQIQNIE